MLPEILKVRVEGGGATMVPLTPLTTFKDVSACVRDPGDPLPLIVEESPLGERVVSAWERPLELLRLWGKMKNQVTYNASFTLSHHLKTYESVSPTKRSLTPDSHSNHSFDPWELYELRDELKHYENNTRSTQVTDPYSLSPSGSLKEPTYATINKKAKKTSVPTPVTTELTKSYSSISNMKKYSDSSNKLNNNGHVRTNSNEINENVYSKIKENRDKENDVNFNNITDEQLGISQTNSHSNLSELASNNLENHSNNLQDRHLKKLLRESKIAAFREGNATFSRTSILMKSFPLHDAEKKNQYIYNKNRELNILKNEESYIPNLRNEGDGKFYFSTSNPIYKDLRQPDYSYLRGRGSVPNGIVKTGVENTTRNQHCSQNETSKHQSCNGFVQKVKEEIKTDTKSIDSIFPKIFSLKSKRQSKINDDKTKKNSKLPVPTKIENKNKRYLNEDVPKTNSQSIKYQNKNSSCTRLIPCAGVAGGCDSLDVSRASLPEDDSNSEINDRLGTDKTSKTTFLNSSDRSIPRYSDIANDIYNPGSLLDYNIQSSPPFSHSPESPPNSREISFIQPSNSPNSFNSKKTPIKSLSSRLTGPIEPETRTSAHLQERTSSEPPKHGTNSEPRLSRTSSEPRQGRVNLEPPIHGTSLESPYYRTSSEPRQGRLNFEPPKDGTSSEPRIHRTSSEPREERTSFEEKRGSTRLSRRPSRIVRITGSVDHRRSYSDPLCGSDSVKRDRIFNPEIKERLRRYSGDLPAKDADMKDSQIHLQQIPEGADLSLSELRDMAMRQQRQIDAQQQLLTAREHRLKFLKQQEGRSAQISLEADRLRRLRERVEAQEAKLRRLRALRGQVDSTQASASSLSADLEAMRHLFSEKEKELVDAAAKVEALTKQLEDIRAPNGTYVSSQANVKGVKMIGHNHQMELEKLRRELLYRNGLNRDTVSRVTSQKEILSCRKDEIEKIDKRIADLQHRIYRKRYLNQQLASQINAAAQAKQAQLKASQQKLVKDASLDKSVDDVTDHNHSVIEDLNQFERGIHDPKYQTLPYNTKFSTGVPRGPPDGPTLVPMGSGPPHPGVTGVTRMVHSIPTHPPSKGMASAPNTGLPPSPVGAPTTQPVKTNSGAAQPRTISSMHYQQKQQQQQLKAKHHHQQQQQQQGSQNQNQDDVKTRNENNLNNQEFSSGLPPTSLSASFGQQQQQQQKAAVNGQVSSSGVPEHHQQLQQSSKDVENVRAAGFPAGSFLNAGPDDDGRPRPVLPPKPPPLGKPLPPPRQKGDPLAGSTESLHLSPGGPGVSRSSGGHGRPQSFRYASQNVILSTYTQQQSDQKSSSANDLKTQQEPNQNHALEGKQQVSSAPKENQHKEPDNSNRLEPKQTNERTENLNHDHCSDKIHISMNRRIEMPPDFLFPEDATPPSDLLGGQTDPILNYNQSTSMDRISNFNEVLNIVNNNNKLESDKSYSNVNNLNAVNLSLKEMSRLKIDQNDNTNVHGEESTSNPQEQESKEDLSDDSNQCPSTTSVVVRRLKKGNLKTGSSSRVPRRVSFDPLALLLDASLEGELELVRRTASEVPNPSAANDEGITALHNAICAGHLDIVTFLVTFGCDVNAQDSDGWTPLHCAASCNNLSMVRFLVEHGACVLATTLSDHETAAEKCEQDEEGYDGCSQYLYSVQEKLGIMNGGVVYAVFDYASQNEDELDLNCSDVLTVIRRGDEYEREWWWTSKDQDRNKCGYVPRNLLGLFPRVSPNDST